MLAKKISKGNLPSVAHWSLACI